MQRVKRTYAKEDCVHYKNVRMKVCCGRHAWGGVCVIPDDTGRRVHKTCSTKTKYCNYVAKEDENVHST